MWIELKKSLPNNKEHVIWTAPVPTTPEGMGDLMRDLIFQITDLQKTAKRVPEIPDLPTGGAV